MRNLTKGLLIAAAVVATGWLLLSTLYTQSVSEELTRLRRESRSDVVYLRNRIKELESELTAGLLDRLTPPSEAVDGEAEPDTAPVIDADPAGKETTPAEPSTEAVTVPTHKTPETQTPTVEAPETDSSAALYLLSEHNGVIGVFDASGELLRTVNVFVMTLPEADREALAVGIPAFSWQELCELVERYE